MCGVELLVSKDYVSGVNVCASFELVSNVIWILLALLELDLGVSKPLKEVKFKSIYVLDLSENKFGV